MPEAAMEQKTVIQATLAPTYRVVPRVATPLQADDAAKRLRQFPPVNRASGPLLQALIWMETAGTPMGFNVGNITARSTYDGEVWRPPWFEVSPASSPKMQALNKRMKEGTAPSAFRNYPNFEAAFVDFFARLKADFPEVLAAAQTGDAAEFVQALSLKYSKDYGPAHVSGFTSLQKKFEPLFQDLSGPVNVQHPAQNRVVSSFGGVKNSLGGALLLGGLVLLAKAVR